MFAWIDNSIPSLFNAKSMVLFLVLSFLAHLVSSRSSLEKKERDRLVLVYPMLIFVYVLLFQVFLLSLNPYVHYYLSPPKAIAWTMNTGICCALGIAFSIRIYRTPGIGCRIYGVISTLIFLLLLLGGMAPPVMQT
jgi:membrane-associated HD superfamily phosphohydrolase